MKGIIKWFNDRKGYGFINGEDGEDIFVHRNDLSLEITLIENDQVGYTIVDLDRGAKSDKCKRSFRLLEDRVVNNEQNN